MQPINLEDVFFTCHQLGFNPLRVRSISDVLVVQLDEFPHATDELVVLQRALTVLGAAHVAIELDERTTGSTAPT